MPLQREYGLLKQSGGRLSNAPEVAAFGGREIALPRVLHWGTVVAISAAFSAWFVCQQMAAVDATFAQHVPPVEYIPSAASACLTMLAFYLALPGRRSVQFPLARVAGFAISIALGVFVSLIAGALAYAALLAICWLGNGPLEGSRSSLRRRLVEYVVPFVAIAASYVILLPSVSPLYSYHAASRAYETYESSTSLAIRNYVAAHYFSFSAFTHTFWGMIQDVPTGMTSSVVALFGLLGTSSLWDANSFFEFMSLIFFAIYVFAAYFAYLLLREFGIRWSIALATALIFFIGNRFYLTMEIQDMGWIGGSFVALTASLWLIVVALRRDSYAIGGWSGLALASQFYVVAPHPEMVIYSVAIYIIVALAFVTIAPTSTRLRAFLICVASGSVFTVVSLAYLVPIASQLLTGSAIVHGEAADVPEEYAFRTPGLVFYLLLLAMGALLEIGRWLRVGKVRPALVAFLAIALPILSLTIPGVPTAVHDFFSGNFGWTVHLLPLDRLMTYVGLSSLILAALGLDAALDLVPPEQVTRMVVYLVKEYRPFAGRARVNLLELAAFVLILVGIPRLSGSDASVMIVDGSLQGIRESLQAVLANSLREPDRQASIPFLRARLLEFEQRSGTWDIAMLPAVRREYNSVLSANGAKSAGDLPPERVRDVVAAMAGRIDEAYASVSWLDDIPENVDRYLAGLDNPYTRVMAVVGAHDLDKQLHQKAFLSVARNVTNAHNNTVMMDTRAYIGYPTLQALYIYPRNFLAHYRVVHRFGEHYSVTAERPPWHYETQDVIDNEFRRLLGIAGVGAYLMLPEPAVFEALARPGNGLKRLSAGGGTRETMVLVRDLNAYHTAYLARVVSTVPSERIEALAEASRKFFSQRIDLRQLREVLDPIADALLGMPRRHDAIVEEMGDHSALDDAMRFGAKIEGPAARGGSVEIKGVVGPRIGLEVQCPDPHCVVVYNLAALPGWRAYVDEEVQLIRRANYGFISVIVPKGSHYVSLFYATPGQSIAEWASLLAVLGMLGLARAGARREPAFAR